MLATVSTARSTEVIRDYQSFVTLEGEWNDAIERAREGEGWELDPVYTGKALAALLDDARAGAPGPLLFWNTMSSRPLAVASAPATFARWSK